MEKLKIYKEEHRQKLEQSQIIYENAKKDREQRSRTSSAASGSNMIGTGPLLRGEKISVTKRPDSRASSSSRLSFLPSANKDRNRFFTPKQMDVVPPSDTEV